MSAPGMGHAAYLGFAQEATWGTPIAAATDWLKIRPGGGFDYDPGYTDLEDLPGAGLTMQDPVLTNETLEGSHDLTPTYEGLELLFRACAFDYTFTDGLGSAKNVHDFELNQDCVLKGTPGPPVQDVKPLTVFTKDTSLTDKTRQYTSCVVRGFTLTINEDGLCDFSIDWLGQTESSLAITDASPTFTSSPAMQGKHLGTGGITITGGSAIDTGKVKEVTLSVQIPWSTRTLLGGKLASPVLDGPFDVSGSVAVEMEDPTADYTTYRAGTILDDFQFTLDSGVVAVGSDNYKLIGKVHRMQLVPPSGWRPEGFGPVVHNIPFRGLWDSAAGSALNIQFENAYADAT